MLKQYCSGKIFTKYVNCLELLQNIVIYFAVTWLAWWGSKQTEHVNEESFCITRNRTNEIIDKAKTEFYTTPINENQSNIKSFGVTWMNLPQKIASRLHPVLWLMVTKSLIPWKLQIALTTFFTSMVQKCIPSNENALLDRTNLRNFVKSKIEPSDMFGIPIMSEDQVLNFLGVLDETKTTGMDGVSAKLLKMSAPVQWNLWFKTTALSDQPLMRDHFSWNLDLHFYTFIPLMKDHLLYKTTFGGPMSGLKSQDSLY